MSYATGVAADRNAVLDALRQFAQSNGWTINQWSVDGTGQRLHLSKGQVFANLNSNDSTNTVFGLYGSTGYTPGLAWSAPQPNGGWKTRVEADANLFPCTYHFFANSAPEMMAGVLVSTGTVVVTRHFCFGEMQKLGTWTDGMIYGGHTYNDGWFSASYGEYANTEPFHLTARMNGGWRGGQFNLSYLPTLFPCGIAPRVNAFNNLSALMPIRVGTYSGNNRIQFIGFVPHMRLLRTDNIPNGGSIMLGSEEWVVFWRTNSMNAEGIAHRK